MELFDDNKKIMVARKVPSPQCISPLLMHKILHSEAAGLFWKLYYTQRNHYPMPIFNRKILTGADGSSKKYSILVCMLFLDLVNKWLKVS